MCWITAPPRGASFECALSVYWRLTILRSRRQRDLDAADVIPSLLLPRTKIVEIITKITYAGVITSLGGTDTIERGIIELSVIPLTRARVFRQEVASFVILQSPDA